MTSKDRRQESQFHERLDSPCRQTRPASRPDRRGPAARERRSPDSSGVHAALRRHARPQESRAHRRSGLRALTRPSEVSRQAAPPHSELDRPLRGRDPGTRGGDNSTILLDLDNAPQPDGLLFIQPEYGGQVKINEDGYIEGGPDLVAEVAASSASYDLHDKLNAYRRNGVREYVVYRVFERKVDWFVLKEGRFEALAPSADGLLRSTIFPGLWLDAAALIRGDLATVLAVVQQGLSSPEHAEFEARLQALRSSTSGLK